MKRMSHPHPTAGGQAEERADVLPMDDYSLILAYVRRLRLSDQQRDRSREGAGQQASAETFV